MNLAFLLALLGVPVRQEHQVTALSAAGSGNDQIRNDNSAMQMVIIQLSIITNPTSSAQCVVSPPTGIIDTAYFAGTGDVAEGFYVLMPGDYINLAYTSGPASGTGIATYNFVEVPL